MDDIEWCIDYLKRFNHIEGKISLQEDKVLRALMNITMPLGVSDEFYKRQDKAIQRIIRNKKMIDAKQMGEIEDRIVLYKGDITGLRADAIVDACNEKLLH